VGRNFNDTCVQLTFKARV